MVKEEERVERERGRQMKSTLESVDCDLCFLSHRTEAMIRPQFSGVVFTTYFPRPHSRSRQTNRETGAVQFVIFALVAQSFLAASRSLSFLLVPAAATEQGG